LYRVVEVTVWVILAGFLSVLPACQRDEDRRAVILPETGLLMLRPRWAIVIEPYARLLAEPDSITEITGHLRRGDVVEIVEIGTQRYRGDGDDGNWYLVEGEGSRGWVLNSLLAVYGSRAQADNASRAITAAAADRKAE
jgi:hypothetical protein